MLSHSNIEAPRFSIDAILQTGHILKSNSLISSTVNHVDTVNQFNKMCSNFPSITQRPNEETFQCNENKQLIRRRCSFNALQIRFLEMEFARSRYISAERRNYLAICLGLTQQQIKIWYQNRRYKTKNIAKLKNLQSIERRPKSSFWIHEKQFNYILPFNNQQHFDSNEMSNELHLQQTIPVNNNCGSLNEINFVENNSIVSPLAFKIKNTLNRSIPLNLGFISSTNLFNEKIQQLLHKSLIE